MRNLRVLSLIFIISFVMSSCAQDSLIYNWKEINEFKFYGGSNPLDNQDAHYILADVELVIELLSDSKETQGYLPKGGQNYATITFNDSRIITIQILPGLPAPIRVIEGNLFDDDWFDFDEKTAMKWLEYIHLLNDRLKSQ